MMKILQVYTSKDVLKRCVWKKIAVFVTQLTELRKVKAYVSQESIICNNISKTH